MFRVVATVLILSAPTGTLANDFEPVREEGSFLSLVQDRELRIGIYNLSLNVLPDGKIRGKALGWDITGSWKWQDGYFCREMDWSGMVIEYNCQLVEVREGDRMRFTVDKGAGDAATFQLR